MSLNKHIDRDDRFIDFLGGLAASENRGAIAALRRGLSAKGYAAPAMHRYVVGWLASNDKPWDEDCIYLVAALFGRYPAINGAEGNLGVSCHLFQQKKKDLFQQKKVGESFERRFVALLAADPASVGVHLRHMVSLLASEAIAIDWAQLLRDLRRWGNPEGRVQRQWAREFWKHDQPSSVESDAEQVEVEVH